MANDDILETVAPGIETVQIKYWHGPFSEDTIQPILTALEDGKVIVLEDLSFLLHTDESALLQNVASGKSRKNISFDHHRRGISNTGLEGKDISKLEAMMERFANHSMRLMRDLLPSYAPALERARCSFRPDEITFRAYSPRQDDRRLHVDAFPSRPSRGRRILRLFSNIALDGTDRHWQVGQPSFHSFAQSFFPRVKPAFPGSSWALERLGLTKGRRSPYDHMMLELHDLAKLDARFQEEVQKIDLLLKPGTSWFCFSDQVLHAALSGHSALEQTFYLPVSAMANPLKSPLRILETLSGRKLI